MRDFLNKTVVSLKPSGIRKFFDIAARLEDCISLGVGEPDFETPWHISEQGIYSIERGETFYTSNQGLPELREEVCAWNKRKYGIDYQRDCCLITVGGSEAIDLALRATVEPGDEVIVLEPSYVCYTPDALLSGAKVIRIELKEEHQFKLQPEQLEAVITPKTKILILNYPNNPTGAIMDKEDYSKIVPIILKHDLLVISDEIYSELTYDGTHCSIASFEGMKDRTILVNGFSKAFSMTGWRIGYALGPKEILAEMKKIHQFTIMCVSTSAQYASIEALKNGDEDILTMKKQYDARRKYLLKEFKKMGIPCFEPKGAFYLFPCIKEFGMDSESFCTRLLEEQRLVLVPGTAFGDCGEGYVRVSYANSMDNLEQAIKRLKRFIEGLEK
jgi:aminotransferase